MADPKTDFIPGAGLLTNMEDYALIVHKEADDYAKKVRAETDAYKSRIEAEYNDVVEKKRQAEDETARMVAEAQQAAETVKKNAETQGFAEGQQKAYEHYQIELETQLVNLTSLVEQLVRLKSDLIDRYEQEILKICLLMAKVIIKSELSTREDVVLEALKKVLKKAQDLGKVRIYLHSVDVEFIRQNSESLRKLLDPDQFVQIIDSDEIKPGNARIETDFTKIDLDIAEQVRKLDTYLLNPLEARKQAFGQKPSK